MDAWDTLAANSSSGGDAWEKLTALDAGGETLVEALRTVELTTTFEAAVSDEAFEVEYIPLDSSDVIELVDQDSYVAENDSETLEASI